MFKLENMNDSENICLSCGICCEGTVIGFVKLDRAELPVMRELMDVEGENDNAFFLQPCKNYCDGCTIYSERSKQCVSFKCELLKSVEQKELDFDLAIETIAFVKQKREIIEKKLAILQIELRSQSFYFKMVELKKVLQKIASKSSLTKNHLELITDLEQLEGVLLEKMGFSFD